MLYLIGIFLISLASSLSLTPAVRWFGLYFQIVDVPNHRKIHVEPIPRVGGLSLFLTFFLSLFLIIHLFPGSLGFILSNNHILPLFAGGVVCLILGFVDDLRGVRPGMKLIFQALAATLAFFGGIKIQGLGFSGTNIELLLSSYFLTMLYFLVFINAVNIIDGLDGLASGILFIASSSMLAFSLITGEWLSAMMLTGLCGGLLGFLKYNFTRASIFLGDAGSYLLGYLFAGLSILLSIRAHSKVALFVGIFSVGIPILDIFFAAGRRYMYAKNIFFPDKEHIHHKLLQMGYSVKETVCILYAVTASLCVIGIIAAILLKEKAFSFLILYAGFGIIFVNWLGYFPAMNSNKVIGWLKNLVDDSGLSNDHRSFLGIQDDIRRAETYEQVWINITRALNEMHCEYVAFYKNETASSALAQHAKESNNGEVFERRSISPIQASVGRRSVPPDLDWSNPERRGEPESNHSLLRIEFPLTNSENIVLGIMVVVMNIKKHTSACNALRRLQQLEKTIVETVGKFNGRFSERRMPGLPLDT